MSAAEGAGQSRLRARPHWPGIILLSSIGDMGASAKGAHSFRSILLCEMMSDEVQCGGLLSHATPKPAVDEERRTPRSERQNESM